MDLIIQLVLGANGGNVGGGIGGRIFGAVMGGPRGTSGKPIKNMMAKK